MNWKSSPSKYSLGKTVFKLYGIKNCIGINTAEQQGRVSANNLVTKAAIVHSKGLEDIPCNPITTRICHVIYCHGVESYPCLVGIGLNKKYSASLATYLCLFLSRICGCGMPAAWSKCWYLRRSPMVVKNLLSWDSSCQPLDNHSDTLNTPPRSARCPLPLLPLQLRNGSHYYSKLDLTNYSANKKLACPNFKTDLLILCCLIF